MMAPVTESSPLLCELHAHTTWSDGVLGVRALCDLYGRSGFDVLAVTDHAHGDWRGVHAGNYDSYRRELEKEGRRARALYGLLVVPGLELTSQSGRVVALGLRSFVDVSDGLDAAIDSARDLGAALIAAAPELAPRVDRIELFGRRATVDRSAADGFPAVATGDFHRPDHLASWKTLLPCARDEHSVVAYLRSPRPAYLVPPYLVRLEHELRAAA
jgi:hypothetical protein